MNIAKHLSIIALFTFAVGPLSAQSDQPWSSLVHEGTMQEAVSHFLRLFFVFGLKVVGAVVILAFGYWLAKWISTRAYTYASKSNYLDASLRSIARKIVFLTVMAVVMIAVLGNFGVETASLVAVLGTAGLAIGLALQGTLSNVAAGVMILALRPFKPGDAIKVGGGEVYLVDEVGLFVTRARQRDCPRVVIPNSKIWGNEIVNFSDTYNGQRRFDLIFDISYGDDISEAIVILRKMVEAEQRVLSEPAPFIKVNSLGDSSVSLLVRVHCLASDWYATKLDLTKAGKEALEAGGKTIPFPQRDIHLNTKENSGCAMI